MKVLLLLLFTPLISFSQKIAENKIDEFTHNRVIRTSWEELAYKFNGSMYAHTRISHINEHYYLEFKYVGSSTSAMIEGSEFMLKLSNDSIITLKNLETQLQCIGCGAIGLNSSGRVGLDVNLLITQDQLELLAANKVVKVRFYLTGGYIENEIGKKNGDNLPRQASLILK